MTDAPVRIAIAGANGRMGQAVAAILADESRAALAGRFNRHLGEGLVSREEALSTAEVVIDFYYSRVYDGSALEVIDALAERYRQAGKRLHLRHLSPECRGLLQRARDWVEVNIAEDPHYHVASDRLG